MTEAYPSKLRLALAGDTHGRISSLEQGLKKATVDHLLFTGDYYGDAVRIAEHLQLTYDAVLGNCDHYDKRHGERVEEKLLEFCGWRFLLVHGHRYGIKSSLNSLYYRAAETEARIVVFGHTHIPMCEDRDGIWLMNPGSPSFPRGLTPKGSYIILDLDQSHMTPHVIPV